MINLSDTTIDEITTVIQKTGVDGAGGAGFPAYAKWGHLGRVEHLLVNHQESEPNFYKDKWLGQTQAETFADLFDSLLEAGLFKTIVVGAKITDRDEWLGPLEDATDADVRTPGDLQSIRPLSQAL